MIQDILFRPEYGFLRMAFLLSALASISFGLIGSFVVVRRIGYLAGAISHCAFGGIGIGLWLKQTLAAGLCGLLLNLSPESRISLSQRTDPILVAVLVAVACALLIGIIRKKSGEREDTLIGIVWSLGMAIGLLFLDRTSGYVSITGYLFGDIILISQHDVWTVALLGASVLLVTTVCFRKLRAVCFDEEFVRLRNVAVDRYFQLLLVLVAVTVVLMLRIVGMLLVIALLTIPAATAARLTKRLGPMIILAIFFCFVGSWTGIYLSFLFDFSAGPMIILVVAMIYAIVLVCPSSELKAKPNPEPQTMKSPTELR